MLSNISSARTTSMVQEGSDMKSNGSSSSSTLQTSKRQRTSGYKGVVFHANGRWGTQIYSNHQRVWIGTFKSEKEAAMAYDSAAVLLLGTDCHRNFPLNDATVQEHSFQELFSKDVVLGMLKDGSYQSKFMDFLSSTCPKIENGLEFNLGKGSGNEGGYVRHLLFQKELTPSDVGKLNRLVIPKKHAIKYFPQVSESDSADDKEAGGGGVDDVQLDFYDTRMKSWKFRYCYWKSSQSFVFTKGWNKFVKEKDLRSKDNVSFYRCENPDLLKGQQVFFLIEVQHTHTENNLVREPAAIHARKMGPNLKFPGSSETDLHRIRNEEEEKVVIGLGPPSPEENKSVLKIFGVQIN